MRVAAAVGSLAHVKIRIGREVLAVVGHFTFRALVRRELSACMSAVYAFAEERKFTKNILVAKCCARALMVRSFNTLRV